MQPDGPYNFIRVLGLCQVGAVWSAIDEHNRAVTVAVLDEPVARDQRWRDAFAATVNGLAQPGPDRPRFLRGDFAAATPWAAYDGALGAGPGAERVFEALGMQVRPAEGVAAAGPADDADPSAPTARLDLHGNNHGTAVVANPWPAVPGPATGADPAAYPTSAPPDPVSGLPVSGQPVSGQPQSPASYDLVYSPSPSYDDPFASPVRHIVPSERRPRRTWLWVSLAILAVVVLGAAGTLFAVTQLGGDDPAPTPTPTAAAPVPVPTGTAAHPGLEPPRSGVWPAKWPKFTAVDKVQRFNLDGLGFGFTAPDTWQCARNGNAEGSVKYDCGSAAGAEQTGGELVVRPCAAPCEEDRRVAMRKAEEAWGLQWNRASRLSSYAETTEVDGQQRYGLVIVAYWRSTPDGAVDRQVVMRMTAPVGQADTLRKVANSVRVGAIF